MKKLLLRYQLSNQPVEIIYMDKSGRFTQRTVLIKKIDDGQVTAFCTLRRQQRSFQLERILSVAKGGRVGESKQNDARKQSQMGV